jgi:hypothetical protein
MTQDVFNRERLYQATIAIARNMRTKGIITEDEFAIFDTKMREKYKPLLGSLSPVKSPN